MQDERGVLRCNENLHQFRNFFNREQVYTTTPLPRELQTFLDERILGAELTQRFSEVETFQELIPQDLRANYVEGRR